MEWDANVLTLVVITALIVWKVREALKDLEARASHQLRRSALGASDADDNSHGAGEPHGAHGQPPATDGARSVAIAHGLADLRLADGSFEPDRFIDSVRIVYETVVLAFAMGDRPVLRELVSPDVYETFSDAVAQREARRESVALSFIGLNRVEIVAINVFNGLMQVTLDLEGEIVTVTRDAAGQVVAGDPVRIVTAQDRWTFEKEGTSRSPVWKLAATEMPPERKSRK
jgi:predicted lipid-binding transport protein (Tim44 family)